MSAHEVLPASSSGSLMQVQQETTSPALHMG
jgi:hypothetical protein